MRYVIYAIVIYLIYLFIRRFLRIFTQKNNFSGKPEKKERKRSYDVNMIQDAEYREINNDK